MLTLGREVVVHLTVGNVNIKKTEGVYAFESHRMKKMHELLTSCSDAFAGRKNACILCLFIRKREQAGRNKAYVPQKHSKEFNLRLD
jgi:hypothetical protein